MNARRLVVAAAIVDSLETPTVLLGARRSKPAQIAGRWEFPGGKVEPGEEPHDGLRRELREELGVEVALGRELRGPDLTGSGDPGWFITERHVMRIWFASLTSGQPEPLVEHDELRWLSAAQLWTVPWLDGDVRIVTEIAAVLGGRR